MNGGEALWSNEEDPEFIGVIKEKILAGGDAGAALSGKTNELGGGGAKKAFTFSREKREHYQGRLQARQDPRVWR